MIAREYLRSIPLIIAIPLVLGACSAGRHLSPSLAADRVASDPGAAVVSTAGIEFQTKTGTWSGEPRRFTKFIPVLVKITNDGDIPLLIRHRDFSLATDAGERVTATPPFDIDAVEVEANRSPIYGALSHGGHSYRSHGFYGLGRFGGFGGHGFSGYSGRYYSPFRQIGLPTGDMVAKALPEGIVEPGERVAGFLYFKKFDNRDVEQVKFEAELVNADSRTRFATVAIPFTTDAREAKLARTQGRRVAVEDKAFPEPSARRIGTDALMNESGAVPSSGY